MINNIKNNCFVDGTSAIQIQQEHSPTLTEFITDTWMPLAVEDGELKDSTISFYKSMCKRIFEFFQDTPIDEIKGLDIDRFMKHLRSEQENGKVLSPCTVQHYFNTLRTIFQYAYCHEVINKNPFIIATKPKVPMKDVNALSQEEIQQFMRAVLTVPLDFQCMLLLFLTTGIRRGECMGLQWQDVNFSDMRIHIQRTATRTKGAIMIGTPKTLNSVRFVPISKKMSELLKEYLEHIHKSNDVDLGTAFLFPGRTSIFQPRDPTSVTRKVKSFMKKNGLSDYSPHDLRHTTASQMLACGADIKSVQNILGHSNPSTTLKFYAKADLKQMKEAANKFTSAYGL